MRQLQHLPFLTLLTAIAISTALVPACSGSDDSSISGETGNQTDAGASKPDASTGSDSAAVDTGSTDSHVSFCQGSGPVITVSPGVDKCTGQLAEQFFKYALCSCKDVRVIDTLHTDGFDSKTPNAAKNGAPVGVNETFSTIGGADIGGSLYTAGSSPLALQGTFQFRGDVKSAGPISFMGTTTVQRDTWVNDKLTGVSSFKIGRNLHHPAGTEVSSGVSVGKDTIEGAVQVPPPCDCSHPLDIASIVAKASGDNDNQSINLDPGVLANLNGNKNLDLPCGRFYLKSIGGVGTIKINVHERVALFIAGDIDITGSLSVSLAPKAEIDVFVAGSVKSLGDLSLGDEKRPAATRLYVGGSDQLDLTGGMKLVTNLYAPHAKVHPMGEVDVFGAVFAKDFDAMGKVSVHYDRGILQAGDDCNVPPPSGCKNTCTDCDSAQACVNGVCGKCSTDSDCCAPLICSPNGDCMSLIK